MNAKRKLAMSGVAILVVLTLVAGATMAWFTDTEKVNANFEAGVLDITIRDNNGDPATTALKFENLRPMEYGTFETEALAVLNETSDPYAGEGYAPTPVYVQKFAITNDGTLPVNLKLSFEETEGTEEIHNIVPNGVGGIKQEGTRKSANELGKAFKPDGKDVNAQNYYAADSYSETEVNPYFHVVLFQKVGTTWEVANVAGNGNPGITLTQLKDGYVLKTAAGEEVMLPAGKDNTSTYALGAYLDEDAGNEYQGKDYNVDFTVNAKQTDAGATFAPAA